MDRVRQGLAALAIALTAGCTSLPTRKPLTVCVLNDSLAPVEADIEQITSETIAQYEQHIGVRLELTHKGDWPFVVPQVPYERLAAVGEYLKENDGSHAPMILEAGEKRPEDATVVDFNAVGDAITRACPADIRILFTNKKLYFASVKEGRLRARTITGNYEKGSGSVFLYDVDAQVPLTDACGNPRVETVLKHEIGHKWYGDGHDKDKRSFMHGPAYESCGEWTKEVTRSIGERALSVSPTIVETAGDRIEEALGSSPFVERIRRCDTPGAKRLLVVLQHAHYREPIVIKPGDAQALQAERDLYASINAIQCNNYQILEALQPIVGERILTEGLWDASIESIAAGYHHVISTLESKELIPALQDRKEDERVYANILDQLRGRYPSEDPGWPSYACIPGAPHLLALQGKASLVPIENARSRRAYTTMRQAMARGDTSAQYAPSVVDDREDAVLDIAARLPSPSSIVAIGAGHQFGGAESCGDDYPINPTSQADNVAKRNKTHRKKFSLIEITPKGF